MTDAATIEARAARLDKLDPRLGPLYKRAAQQRECSTPADAMNCAHLVREIMDGCLAAVGQVPVLEQALPKLQKLQKSVDNLIGEIQTAAPVPDVEFRKTVLSSLQQLREPGGERLVHMPEMMGKVVRQMGVADASREATVVAVAMSARSQGGSHLHLGPKNRDEESRKAGAQKALRTLELFLDAVDTAFTPKLTAMKSFLVRANGGDPLGGVEVRHLAAILVDDDSFRQFFLGLQRIECLPNLMSARLISPREPTAKTGDGEALDPIWWAGEYLLRMAPAHPKEVVDAILAQAPETISESVASVIRRVGAKLPAAQYKRLHARIVSDIGGEA